MTFFYGFALSQYSFAQNGKNTKEAIIEEHLVQRGETELDR